MAQPLLSPHPGFRELRREPCFLPGHWGCLVKSGTDASRCISCFWAKLRVWYVVLCWVFNPDTKGTVCLTVFGRILLASVFLSSHEAEKTKPQTIFMVSVNLLLRIDMMYLYSVMEYYLPCLVSMGVQLCTYMKCYKINVKKIITILVLIYTQRQEVWFLCNSYISALWSQLRASCVPRASQGCDYLMVKLIFCSGCWLLLQKLF